ncbi:MAG: uroporphyrinogen-III synthase [Acidimicrobiales bacterium]
MTAGPLDGFTVGVTADRRAEEQAELLRARGATVVLGPTIHTSPVDPDRRLREVTEALVADPPGWVLANTGIGVRGWFSAADSWGLGDLLVGAFQGARVVARGPKAAGVIHSLGLEVAWRAPTEELREVVAWIREEADGGGRMAFQLDGGENLEPVAALRAAGIEVVEVPVYRWRLPQDPRPALRLVEAAVEGRLHAITFTSAPAVANLFSLAAESGDALGAALNGGVVAACVGPVCGRAARAFGVTDPLVPERPRLGPLVAAVADRLGGEVRRTTLGTVAVELRGTVAVIGDERVELSDREAGLLDILVARDGTVVGKGQLLTELWHDPSGDPHLVEVTVARLRRRLGPAGAAIITVPRRGYRLAAAAS